MCINRTRGRIPEPSLRGIVHEYLRVVPTTHRADTRPLSRSDPDPRIIGWVLQPCGHPLRRSAPSPRDRPLPATDRCTASKARAASSNHRTVRNPIPTPRPRRDQYGPRTASSDSSSHSPGRATPTRSASQRLPQHETGEPHPTLRKKIECLHGVWRQQR